jgi:hypothetical protein
MPKSCITHLVFEGMPRNISQKYYFCCSCYSSVCSIHGPILQTVHFACITSLWVEGKKKMHILCKPETLSTQEMRRQATKYCHWEIMFIVWTVYASLSAAPLTSLIPLPFTSNSSQAHRFVPTTVLPLHKI